MSPLCTAHFGHELRLSARALTLADWPPHASIERDSGELNPASALPARTMANVVVVAAIIRLIA